MKIVDLNVLLYVVNADAIQHARVLAWWHRALADEEPLCLPWVVLLGFLRLATNPRVFPKPLSPEAATGKLDTWLAQESVRVVHERTDHWDTLRSLLAQTGTAGNLTTDAHLAALAISHGALLVSCDVDFRRFRGLRWLNPAD